MTKVFVFHWMVVLTCHMCHLCLTCLMTCGLIAGPGLINREVSCSIKTRAIRTYGNIDEYTTSNLLGKYNAHSAIPGFSRMRWI
jgi:hypothetical protein